MLHDDTRLQGYRVRLARATEIYALPEIESVAAQRFSPYLDQLEISDELLRGLTPLTFLRRAQIEHRLWVAVINEGPADRPVGFIVVKFLPESCFIVEISVHPDHGRKGVGSALIQACCKGAEAKGAAWVTLTTFRQVPWNIPFYQRLGFDCLKAEHWSSEMRAIVQHEDRYGFAMKHRVVMARPSVLPNHTKSSRTESNRTESIGK
ncbi:MAG: GNAT family N-acetyltransferase [Cyanobacteria bacterium J06560_2]